MGRVLALKIKIIMLDFEEAESTPTDRRKSLCLEGLVFPLLSNGLEEEEASVSVESGGVDESTRMAIRYIHISPRLPSLTIATQSTTLHSYNPYSPSLTGNSSLNTPQ